MRSLVSLTTIAAFVVPMVATAQTGSASGTLSERAYYIAQFRGSGDSATIELLLILRGEPGWSTRSVAGTGRSIATASAAVGRAQPTYYSLTIGTTTFEYSYLDEGRVLRLYGARYPLDGANVVVIDNVDGAGGPPTVVQRLTLPLPVRVRTFQLPDSLRQIPGLQEFIR